MDSAINKEFITISNIYKNFLKNLHLLITNYLFTNHMYL
jgi:hypothetical protein